MFLPGLYLTRETSSSHFSRPDVPYDRLCLSHADLLYLVVSAKG